MGVQMVLRSHSGSTVSVNDPIYVTYTNNVFNKHDVNYTYGN